MEIRFYKTSDFKLTAIVFVVMVIVSGIWMWLSDYTSYLNNIWIPASSVIICAVCAGIITIRTTYQKRKIVLYAIAAQQTAFLIKVFIDCFADKSNHNLVPFEILMFIIADGVIFSIVVMLFSLGRRSLISRP